MALDISTAVYKIQWNSEALVHYNFFCENWSIIFLKNRNEIVQTKMNLKYKWKLTVIASFFCFFWAFYIFS
jgi:hypothetical protein